MGIEGFWGSLPPEEGRQVQLHPRSVLRDDHDARGGTHRIANLPLGLKSLAISEAEFDFLHWLGTPRDPQAVIAAHHALRERNAATRGRDETRSLDQTRGLDEPLDLDETRGLDQTLRLDELMARGVLCPVADGAGATGNPMPWLQQPKPAAPPGVHPARTPLVLYLELTQNCNLRCRHCFATEAPGRTRMALETVMDLLQEADDLGVLHTTLSGGEPTLHPDFMTILERAAESRMAITLLTNGTLFRKHPEWPERIAHLAQHVNRALNVSISVDGATDATHDSFRGRRGSLQHTRAAVEALARAGFTNISIETTLSPENYRQLPQIVAWAATLGLYSVKPFVVLALGRARADSAPTLGVAEQWEVLDLCSELQEQYAGRIAIELPNVSVAYQAASLSPNLQVPDRPVCSAGMKELAVRADGAIHPCPYIWSESFTLGRFPETRLLQAWQDERLHFFRGGYSLSNLEGCSDCPDAGRCLARVCRAQPIAEGNPFQRTERCFRSPEGPCTHGVPTHVSAS